MFYARRKAIGVIVLSFTLGAFLAFFLPISVLAFIEGVLLIILSWCYFCG
ncbi:MAG: hypothetical protein GX196_07780 [Clostridiaceae bacterium]|nr:hypothetical protein [Clostridiaceae bacterium]